MSQRLGRGGCEHEFVLERPAIVHELLGPAYDGLHCENILSDASQVDAISIENVYHPIEGQGQRCPSGGD